MSKVYIVMQYDCDSGCNCDHSEPEIIKIFKDKERAENYAKALFKAFVRDYEVN
jgi:hypothetical protein